MEPVGSVTLRRPALSLLAPCCHAPFLPGYPNLRGREHGLWGIYPLYPASHPLLGAKEASVAATGTNA